MTVGILDYRFAPRKTAQVTQKPQAMFSAGNAPPDASIEALIDKAGRGEVLAKARRLGWTRENPPPKWVWKSIAADILNAR